MSAALVLACAQGCAPHSSRVQRHRHLCSHVEAACAKPHAGARRATHVAKPTDVLPHAHTHAHAHAHALALPLLLHPQGVPATSPQPPPGPARLSGAARPPAPTPLNKMLQALSSSLTSSLGMQPSAIFGAGHTDEVRHMGAGPCVWCAHRGCVCRPDMWAKHGQ